MKIKFKDGVPYTESGKKVNPEDQDFYKDYIYPIINYMKEELGECLEVDVVQAKGTDIGYYLFLVNLGWSLDAVNDCMITVEYGCVIRVQFN